ncbi:MAG: hypothetical protein GF317_10600 [Candidatus Lokiarchaeota archaeon]|nr:hypothetical protein [Candidatus Lokiarchaeota archaeon]MBD3200110.1 hypothetical protein [Candidatus Lokiarchaeota archaeon]
MVQKTLKLITDAMLGKLTTFLRLFGYDTIYANDLEEIYNIEPVPDNLIGKYGEETNRIIITKDYPFYRKIPERGIYLEGEGVYNFLKQLKLELGLKYDLSMKKARCSACNSKLRIVTNKNDIKDKLNDSTFTSYDIFYQCTNSECQKIFWNGPHIKDIKKRLKNHFKSKEK